LLDTDPHEPNVLADDRVQQNSQVAPSKSSFSPSAGPSSKCGSASSGFQPDRLPLISDLTVQVPFKPRTAPSPKCACAPLGLSRTISRYSAIAPSESLSCSRAKPSGPCASALRTQTNAEGNAVVGSAVLNLQPSSTISTSRGEMPCTDEARKVRGRKNSGQWLVARGEKASSPNFAPGRESVARSCCSMSAAFHPPSPKAGAGSQETGEPMRNPSVSRRAHLRLLRRMPPCCTTPDNLNPAHCDAAERLPTQH